MAFSAPTFLTVFLAAFLAAPALAAEVPDDAMTPGVWREEIGRHEVCATKWGKDVRHVTKAMKDQAYLEYHTTRKACSPKGCEVDHRFPRDLGGADDIRNLWPQPYAGKWNAHMKDRLEARAKREVCSGALSLQEARSWFEGDWRKAYKRLWRRD
jgi:hypothetical protein